LTLADEAPAAESILNDDLVGKSPLAKTVKDLNIKFGGWIEGSFTYNFRHPKSGINEGRVFDFEDDAARLNQIAIQVARTIDTAAASKAGKFDWGFGVDQMYGSDGRLIHSNALSAYQSTLRPINQYDLTQAYVDLFFPVGSGLTVRAGKFVTLFGNETIAPIASITGSSGNALYSHSYNFGFGIPFTQTGVLATYALVPDKLVVTGGFTRGWEQATSDINGAIDFLGEAVYTMSDEWKITGNVSVGPQRAKNNKDYRYLIEGIVAYTPKNSKLDAAVDGIYAWEDHAAISGHTAYWYGVTGYVGYKVCPMAKLNGRLEWFRDDGGSRLGINANVYEATVGVSITPFSDKIGKNLTIRPELREDWSDKRAFGGGKHKDLATAAIDAIFAL